MPTENRAPANRGGQASCRARQGLRLAAGLALALGLLAGASGADRLPVFDAHLHYNREPVARLPVAEAIRLFEASGVIGVLANSRPNDGTRALVAARPAQVRVVPFLRPYRVRADVGTWHADPATLRLVEEEFRQGFYVGLGEFHLHGREAESPVVRELVLFAKRHGLWLHAHSDVAAIETLFGIDPQARIIWAHTGFGTPAAEVDALLARHPGLVGELSYRGGLTAGDGRLTPEWKALFEQRSERFLLGSDTWIDARWDDYAAIIDGYRAWLAQLSPAAAANIAHRNGERLFGAR